MKALIGGLLVALGLIGIPIALVTVPAAAVRDIDKSEPMLDPEPAWATCGVRMECLR
jgi:hypothetical protein